MHINNLTKLRERNREIFRIMVAEDHGRVRAACKKGSLLSEERCEGFIQSELDNLLGRRLFRATRVEQARAM